MRRFFIALAALALLAALPVGAVSEGGTSVVKINVQIGEANFQATLADSAAAAEFARMLAEGPLTLALDDYAGFEKVGPLGRQLSADDEQTTTEPGDIVLYNASNIVMFYGSNAWAYTRIGRIDDLTGWAEALGSGSIEAVFTLLEE